MKKKVVVIDDKPLILQSIVQTIDWHSLDCTVVGQAEDGIEGRRLIADKRPDILITDIKMPGLSGLDLAEHMQAEHPHAKTILITGYQDFEYAQRAIRLGVHDFIVKPVRNDELMRVIRQAVDELDGRLRELERQAEQEQTLSRLEERQRETLPPLRSGILAELLAGSRPMDAELERMAVHLGIPWCSCTAAIVRVSEESADAGSAEPGQASDAPANAALEALFRAAAHGRDFELIETRHRGELTLVFFFPRAISSKEQRLKLQRYCRETAERARRELEQRLCVAVGSVRKQPGELRLAYAEAEALLDSSFFRSDEPVLFPEADAVAADVGKLSIIRDLEQFGEMLERADAEALFDYLERFLTQIAVYSEGNILVAKGLLSDVCLGAARYYFRVTGDEFGLGKSVDEILGDVYRLPDMKRAAEYLAGFIKLVKSKLDGGDKGYSLAVKKSLDYINGHFHENINLTVVADHLGLSSGYLSRLLRTETGINFVDLVARARIDAAKRLLRDPRNKVNEVGERVGFREYAYFYQVFRKLEGMSPKEYKNKSG